LPNYWDESAAVWTELSRQGFNIYADLINTPALLEFLPDITGQSGIDLGCGEGRNSRLIAPRCVSMVGLDISSTFLRHARAAAPHIPYVLASAQQVPLPNESFDFAVASLSLMDMPRPDVALTEACRILRPGGFLQFSITQSAATSREA
jgi:ubiquinone/menaquinone biosynthesis C-methylase UbiE